MYLQLTNFENYTTTIAQKRSSQLITYLIINSNNLQAFPSMNKNMKDISIAKQ